MAFVERVIDVIGADPEVLDSTFRELFSSAGELQFVARWSSAGQKHHAFIGFKDAASAGKALSMPLPRAPNRDWRLSRLNPDLKTRVIELLPKYLQATIKKDELNAPHHPIPNGPPGPSSQSGSVNGGDGWTVSPANMTPSLWNMSGYNGGAEPSTVEPASSSWTPSVLTYDATYGLSQHAPAAIPWGAPSSVTDAPNGTGAIASNDSHMLDGSAQTASRIPNRTDGPSDFTSIAKSPTPPASRWNRAPSPLPSPTFRLPPKPAGPPYDSRDPVNRYPPRGGQQSHDARDRARDNRYSQVRRPSPPPARAPPRYPSPTRANDRDNRGAPRRDSRAEDRDWGRNARERDVRSRSRSPDRGRSRSPARSIRGLPRRGGDFRLRDSRAMSPGQLSSNGMDRSNSLNGINGTSRRTLSPAVMDAPALLDALSFRNAPPSSWMEVISRYRRQQDLDSVDQAALAAIEHFKRTQPNSPEIAKMFFLVLANTHNLRARALPTNSEAAKTHQDKASDWIRQAQAVGTGGDDSIVHDPRAGLEWLQKHMLDKHIPRDVALSSPVSNFPTLVPSEGIPAYSKLSGNEWRASAAVDPLALQSEQSKHLEATKLLEAERTARKRLEEKLKSFESLLRVAESKLLAVESRGNGAASEAELLRRAEAEKLRLLAVLNDERLAKRKAEDAEQEERAVRRKLEDKLWELGVGTA